MFIEISRRRLTGNSLGKACGPIVLSNRRDVTVGPLYLFELASSQARWLELRQSTIAANVANANTPGFKARDVEPFNKILDGMPVRLAMTSPAHMQLSAVDTDTRATAKKDSWEVVHSGNSVSLEQEMVKGGDVNRD